MALPQGINFRATLGYVTDGANEAFQVGVAATPDYPRTSAQGNTIGWETITNQVNHADRNNTVDRRLAGINYAAGVSSPYGPADYRIDLPATGNYNVRCAAGDHAGGGPIEVQLLDTTTAFLTISHAAAADTFYDAADVGYSAANWPGSNSAASRTFASTIFRARTGVTATNNCVVAHIYIEVGAAGGRLVKMAGEWGGYAGTSGGFAG